MSGTNLYSNLPPSPVSNNPTVAAMDNYYSKPLAIDSTTYSMMTGFFQSRGFDVSASETTAIALIKQAQLDSYNPINVLDSLKGLNDVSLNNIIAEILNYNRYKTSFLGNATGFTPFEPVARTIIA
jgi:hypothetical protein